MSFPTAIFFQVLWPVSTHPLGKMPIFHCFHLLSFPATIIHVLTMTLPFFQLSSTSSSVLNTTNSKGSTVFGAVPSSPSPSAATCQEINVLQQLFLLTMVSLRLLHTNNLHG